MNVERDLQDPYAGRRVTAIATVEARGDREQVPALIELLDDRDPGVRLAAYSALQDLTGRDTGYRPWADEAERRAAVLAWRAWWKETHPEGVSAPPEGGP